MLTDNGNEVINPEPKQNIYCCLCNTLFDDQPFDYLKCEHCNQSICRHCMVNLVSVVFNNPALIYPFKCPSCTGLINGDLLDEIINQDEFHRKFFPCILSLFWSDDCLDTNEELVSCPFCPYIEIHSIDDCSVYHLKCRNPECQKISCLVCLHSIDDESIEKHRSFCSELRANKKMIENAIELGLKQRCPSCKLTGIKDLSCTHMTCERCGQVWCYFCGMKESECSVPDPSQPSLSAHNTDWNLNKDRCPMYLPMIHEIDLRWPQSDEDCLEYFHRYRTLFELNKVYQILGREKFEEINQHFGTTDASGYVIDQIENHKNERIIVYPKSE